MVGLSVFGLTLAATGPAEAATSVNWGPLTASYKEVKRVEASGKFYIERNAYATNKITLNDPSNDGNNVLATTTYFFWEWNSLCDGDKGGTCWRIDLRKSTGEYNYRNALIGANGSGKTTLLRCLATLPPYSGRATVAGCDLLTRGGAEESKRFSGFLAQQPAGLDRFTVQEGIQYAGYLKGLSAKMVRRRVDDLLGLLGLESQRRAKLGTLSGGTARRAYLAQALVHAPQVLLLDEPTAGLDEEHAQELRGVLRDLGARSTVLVATHVAEDVAQAHHAVVLRRGHLVFDGSGDALRAKGLGIGQGSSEVDVAPGAFGVASL
jgi:ABC-type Na+ transport system ATPase subunit NatA